MSTINNKSKNPSVDVHGATTQEENLIKTVQEITEFKDNAEITSDVQPIADVPVAVYCEESIKQWLMRPHNIATFNWSTANDAGTKIGESSVLNALLNIPSVLSKLENITYIRASIRLSIRINGTKFHYGRLLASWRPLWNALDGTFRGSCDNVYTSFSSPFVALSPTDSDTHEMLCPYTLPYAGVLVNDVISPDVAKYGSTEVCNVRFYVVNPLTINLSDPTPDVSVTLFANLYDIQFFGYVNKSHGVPSLAPPTIQLGPSERVPLISPFYVIQVGTMNVSKEGIQKASRGLISGVAEDVSNVASILSVIPAIGSVASGVSSVASVIGSAAKYLGYCKPVEVSSTTRVRLTYGDIAHVEGVDESANLTLTPDYSIKSVAPYMGSSDTEQSILNYISMPGYLGYYIWTANMVVNTVVDSKIPLSPTTSPTSPPARSINNTPVSNVARCFEYFRGSLNIAVHIVASGFHGGRIRISYIPPFVTAGTEHFGDTVNKVVDISTETEIYLSIPYLHPNYMANTNSQIGTIQYVVLNPLTHPTSPVPPVYINTFIMGGSDMMFAVPTFRGTYRPAFFAEVGNRQTFKRAIYAPIIDAQTSIVDGCVGERIHSINELVKRFTNCFSVDKNLASATIYPFNNLPRTLTRSLVDDRIPPYNTNDIVSYLELFRDTFVYAKGGVSVRLFPEGSNGDTRFFAHIIPHVPVSSDFTNDDNRMVVTDNLNIEARLGGTHQGGYYRQSLKDQPAAVICPYGSTLPFMPLRAIEQAGSYYERASYALGVALDDSQPNRVVNVMLAAADDHEMGFQVGVPQYMAPPVVSGSIELIWSQQYSEPFAHPLPLEFGFWYGQGLTPGVSSGGYLYRPVHNLSIDTFSPLNSPAFQMVEEEPLMLGVVPASTSTVHVVKFSYEGEPVTPLKTTVVLPAGGGTAVAELPGASVFTSFYIKPRMTDNNIFAITSTNTALNFTGEYVDAVMTLTTNTYFLNNVPRIVNVSYSGTLEVMLDFYYIG